MTDGLLIAVCIVVVISWLLVMRWALNQ